ncbi:unnamed protein product [Amaranthus hypochondriacus]
MEGCCTSADSHLTESSSHCTASNFLTNLPSRGVISSTFSSSSVGGIRVYICDHETTPPENQVIKTDQQNILIRALTLKKQSGDATDSSRKRASDSAADGRIPAKRATIKSQNNGRQSGLNSQNVDKIFHSLTVERLQALLKEKGLSRRGKKAELIERLQRST